MINFTYLIQPPKKYTFEMPEVKKWVEGHSKGKVLNLFAGITKLNLDELRIDVDKNTNPDICSDAYEFLTTTDKKFDTVILDPPYNLRKSKEKYNSYHYIGKFAKIKNALPKILNDNSTVITFGYDSVGMSAIRGFEKTDILLICHNGDHHDTIATVEKMTHKVNYTYAYENKNNNLLDIFS